MCADYADKHGLDVRVARLFNTYGIGMDHDDGRVVSNFISQALVGDSVTIYGDGTQTRSFCYVDDTIDGLICLMNSKVLGAVNIGNPTETSMLELYETLQSLFEEKMRGEISSQFVELPVDDPSRRQPDITRATKELGWFPTVDLEEGLSQTIDYFHIQMAS